MNSTELLPLDVFFRADRYYIQGSLIVSESYRVSESRLKSVLKGDDVVLKEVGFRSFLDSSASAILSSDASQSESTNAFGYADFTRLTSLKDTERVFFIAHKDTPASRQKDSPKVITNFSKIEDTVFTCHFTSTVENLVDGFFRSIIEITKKSHTLAFPGCSDILFIGLRKWEFPISNPVLLHQAGKHLIQIGSRMTKNGRSMTVSRITTTLSSGATFKGAITFSFTPAKEAA